MSDTNKNRVVSSKTTRGSQNPHGYAGFDGIVQPEETEHNITLEDVNRVLEVGRILRSALTYDELSTLHQTLYGLGC